VIGLTEINRRGWIHLPDAFQDGPSPDALITTSQASLYYKEPCTRRGAFAFYLAPARYLIISMENLIRHSCMQPDMQRIY
jgi:hypothetical protein